MNRVDSAITQSKSYIGQYAGFVSRLTAHVIDIFIMSAVILFTTWFIATTVNILHVGPLLELLTDYMPRLKALLEIVLSPIAVGIYMFIFIASYYIIFWFLAGKTPGKAFVGIRVVPLSGKKMALSHSIIRYIGYLISAALFGLGFFWIIIDDRRLALHDKLARTCVIYTWDARPDEIFLADALQTLAIQQEGVLDLTSKNGTSLKSHHQDRITSENHFD